MKEAHIYIYGDIGYWQSTDAADWGEVNLKHVKDSYEAQKDCEEIFVHIHSPGGYVTEGFAIHDFLRSQKKPITTIIEGMCYSIATVIALAGDTRMMTSNSDFMIHNPWGGAFGDSNEIQKYADDLKKLEQKAADFYAAKTSITADEALEMMKEETFMTPEDALKHGFITEIATVMKAVAKFDPSKLKPKSSKMAKKNKKTKEQKEALSVIDKAMNSLKGIFGGDSPKNKLIQDANGDEIDFPDLEDDDTPSVGDNATVDGSPADGEYVLPSGETYVFTSGELTEIQEAEDEEEEEEDAEEMAQLKKSNEKLKKSLSKAKAEKKSAEAKAAKAKKAVQEAQKDLEKVRASVKSGFKHETSDKDSSKKNSTEEGTRSVWKKEKK